MVILFSTKCFLFVYIYIDLLKLKAYKLFENSDADLFSYVTIMFVSPKSLVYIVTYSSYKYTTNSHNKQHPYKVTESYLTLHFIDTHFNQSTTDCY